jgi:hypothetical protein
LLGVVVVATAVSALVAHNLYLQPAAAGPPPIVPTTGTSSMPSSEEPGPTQVQITPDVSRDTLHTNIQQILQTYFDAINDKSYGQWRSVVTAAMARQNPEKAFLQGYESTKDGSIVVYRVDTSPDGGLRVLLTFHSVQDVADAPPTYPHTCIAWRVVWALTDNADDNTWRVDAGTTDKSPQYGPC